MAKMAFFGNTEHGMAAGFCGYREDGLYDRSGFFFDEGDHVIDIAECRTLMTQSDIKTCFGDGTLKKALTIGKTRRLENEDRRSQGR